MKQVVFILTLLFIASCSNSYRVKHNDFGKRYYNYQYGKDKKQKLDVFVPNALQDSAFVLLAHGGGWRFGSKSHLRSVQKFLQKNGIASASMDYRLANKKINSSHQLEDMSIAVKFLKDSIFSENKMVLLGESSGGHISLLYAYQNPEQVEKVICYAAPTDFYSDDLQETKFYHWLSKSAFSRAVGERYQWNDSIPQSFEKASPISQVSNVPTYLFQGTWDMLVNKNQAFTLDSILEERGIEHELILIKRANHTPRLMPWWRNSIYGKTLEIIKK